MSNYIKNNLKRSSITTTLVATFYFKKYVNLIYFLKYPLCAGLEGRGFTKRILNQEVLEMHLQLFFLVH